MKITTIAVSALTALACSTMLSACTDDTSADASPTGGWGESAYSDGAARAIPDEIQDNAHLWAGRSAEQCDDVTPSLVEAVIATRSGYLLHEEGPAGAYGYAQMTTPVWTTYATAYNAETGTEGDSDRKPRQDNLGDATMATGAELCAAFSSADTLAGDGVEGSRIDLALATAMIGEGGVKTHGLPVADDEEEDPTGTRVFIAAVVATEADLR